MILKYDVYCNIENDKLVIVELVPIKKKSIIDIPKKEISNTQLFIEHLMHGIGDFETSDFIRKLDHFFKNNRLYAEYLGDLHKEDPFSRQIEMIDSFNRSQTSAGEIQKKLFDKTVLIIGAGGIGTALVNALISCGIGKVAVVDFDKVEKSNLARQFLYTESDIGKSKVEVLAKKINSRKLGKVIPINEKISFKNWHNIINSIGDIDIVTGMPYPSSEIMRRFYKELMANGIPVYPIGEHDVGPFLFNIDQVDKTDKSIQQKFPITSLLNDKRSKINKFDRHPSYLPEIMIATSLGTNELVRYFTGLGNLNTINAVYSIQPDKFTVKLIELK